MRSQSGRLSGARFWKNGSPSAPLTKRLRAIGRPPDAAQRAVGDRQVVADEVELGVAGLGEVDLVRVRDRDLAAADLEDLLAGGHGETIPASGTAESTGAATESARGSPSGDLSIRTRRSSSSETAAAAGKQGGTDALPAPDLHRRADRGRRPSDGRARNRPPTTRSPRTSARRGTLQAGEALQPTSTATTVRVTRRPDGGDGRAVRRDQGSARRVLPDRGARTLTRRSSSRRRSRAPSTARSRCARSGSSPPASSAGRGGRGRRQREPRDVDRPADRSARRRRPPVPRGAGRAVATLIRVLGDFDLAEEAVQEAFVTALETWPARGVPDNPGGLDHDDGPQPGHRPAASPQAARREDASRSSARRRSRRSSRRSSRTRRRRSDMSPIADDRLRLIFTCCHPALGRWTPGSR